jgi:hypothetical protein
VEGIGPAECIVVPQGEQSQRVLRIRSLRPNDLDYVAFGETTIVKFGQY